MAMATESKGIDTASSALENMIWGATCPCENVRDIVDRSDSVDCSYVSNKNCYGTNSWKLVCKVDWNVSRLRLLKDVVGGGEVVVSTIGVLANRVRVTKGGIGPELTSHPLDFAVVYPPSVRRNHAPEQKEENHGTPKLGT